jgi:hypothetical protein
MMVQVITRKKLVVVTGRWSALVAALLYVKLTRSSETDIFRQADASEKAVRHNGLE